MKEEPQLFFLIILSPFGTYMIILSLEKFNNKFKNNKEIYDEWEYIGGLECPVCKSDELIKWGSYKRYTMYIENKSILFESITIKRLKCEKCGHTHAIIPSFIIPYRQMLSDVIISIIMDDEILNKYKFSYNMIEKIKRFYSKYVKSYLMILKTKLSYSNLLDMFKDVNNLYLNYYKETKKIFMMNHKGIFNMGFF